MLMGILDTTKKNLQNINQSRLVAGLAMIILNIGSKYVQIGFSKTQEQALKSTITRELLIFSMMFVATKDLVISIIMTASFMILSNHLFNEKSKFCIASGYLNKLMLEIDRNGDNVISKDEEEWAVKVLKKANENRKKTQQAQFSSYLSKTS
jgi:hypothetical protein